MMLVLLAAIVVFGASLAVYVKTMCPTVGFIDCGELTAVCSTLGIAHPTGYPLYTLLGRLFTLVPWGTVAQRVTSLSVVASALAVVAVFGAIFALTGDLATRGRGGEGARWLWARLLASGGAALSFAFSLTFRSQAVVAEVYNLTALFYGVVLLVLFACQGRESPRPIILVAFLLGLGFGNHMSMIYLVPASAALILLTDHTWVTRPGRALLLAAFFLSGLSLYLYLPLRGGQNPVLNWGNPVTLERFLWHVSGKQYQVWMFSGSAETFYRNLSSFWRLYRDQFTPFLWWIPPLGIFWILVRSWRAGLALLVVVIFNLALALNYDIPDIEPYFLPTFVAAALGLGGGLFLFLEAMRIRGLKPALATGLGGIVAGVVVMFPLAAHYHRMDMSRNHIAYDFGMNALRSSAPGGLILTNNWDMYSPILYINHVEGSWKDTAIVDKELLRRTWYFRYLQRQYPRLIERSKPEVESFLEMLNRFEHQPTLSPIERDLTQSRYLAMINSFIERSLEDGRAVFISFPQGSDADAQGIAPGLHRVPQGLLYRLETQDTVPAFTDDGFSWRGVFGDMVYQDDRTKLNLSNYPRMGFERGVYLAARGRIREAVQAFTGVLRFSPHQPETHQNLAICYVRLGEYARAAEHLRAVLRVRPMDTAAMENLRRIEGMGKGE
jgi:tetratricopeptide (TPR) repeat protein